eukprot:gene7030-11195_t
MLVKSLLKVTDGYLKKSIPCISKPTQNSKRTFFKNTPKFSDNYYDILGISKSSDEKEIKSAYKKKALKYHPDRNPDGAEEFKKINNAYQVLSDSNKRQIYDQYGEEGLNGSESGGFQYANPEDIFSQFFGGGFGGFGSQGGRRNRGPIRGDNLMENFSFPLEDFYNGKKKTFKLPRKTTCSTCTGKGTKEGSKPSKCSVCKGRGTIIQTQQFGPGMVQQVQNTCYNCGGKGEIIKENDKCGTCRGTKIQVEDHFFSFEIEKGSKPFQKIFEGESHKLPETIPGDVIFTIDTQKHPIFQRKGDHLFMNYSISLHESLCGFEFDIEHLDKNIFRVSGKPGEFIEPGSTKVIRGKGMPIKGKKEKFGDLFITFTIDYPQKDSITKDQLDELSKILPQPQDRKISNLDNIEEVNVSTTSKTEIEQIHRIDEREKQQRQQQRRQREHRQQQRQGDEGVECQQQ